MAALQHTPISLQSQTPSSPPQLSSTLTPRTSTLSFSFSSTFTPIPLKLSSSTAAAVTLRRNATKLKNQGAGVIGYRHKKIEKFFGEPSVFDFFINPTIDLDKKRKVLDEIAKSSTLQPHTVNFLNILVEAKRIDLIKDIVKEFEVVYNKITDTELAIVTSVVKLESQHLAQIAKQVQKLTGAQNVRIKTEIDPSLVAGFTVRYGNSGSKLIDLSVKKQLEEIAAELDLGDIKLNL
ncbi:ATP synthase subunit delta, chloroplastic [Prunus avium]|uniref:ATP synthase subunit delta, chloroplastic n=1 Tax=Prunus avium TaxID=42229 RepID=A0A6P5SEG8_PRUAV|nr:ATP synthase subunit delta, chloroplastic [Prunus avium]